jgi:hypothetical protein
LEDFPLTEITTIWEDTARDPEKFVAERAPRHDNAVRRRAHRGTFTRTLSRK